MQAICLITLMFVNGAYLFISFNMESMIPDNGIEQVEEVVVVSSSISTEFDPTDILDLDILDFAVDELIGGGGDGARSRSPHLVHDRV
jgi:hypothetical protein